MKHVIANWKMHLTIRESLALGRAVMLAGKGKSVFPNVVLCPSFPALADVHKLISKSRVRLGAQDVFWQDTGAFTGEVSPRQLKDAGCTHVIIGHSERRSILGVTDEMVNKKLLSALGAGLIPIVCVGESKSDRAAGKAKAVVERQINAALQTVKLKPRDLILFAYEPVWAIGTGVAATPADAVDMHAHIRVVAASLLNGSKAKQLALLYGGSVDEKNAYAFLREGEVDGVLVGGASVKWRSFEGILKAVMEVTE